MVLAVEGHAAAGVKEGNNFVVLSRFDTGKVVVVHWRDTVAVAEVLVVAEVPTVTAMPVVVEVAAVVAVPVVAAEVAAVAAIIIINL